jgi:hypothetical protein
MWCRPSVDQSGSGGRPSALIGLVHAAVQRVRSGAAVEEASPMPKPAVPIKKSVTPDYIVSLEDGKKFKSLKRHLWTHYGLTPDEYRAQWGLPADCPMARRTTPPLALRSPRPWCSAASERNRKSRRRRSVAAGKWQLLPVNTGGRDPEFRQTLLSEGAAGP